MSDIRNEILTEGVISISDKCKGCDECAKACPTNAIVVKGMGNKHVIDPERCLSCGQCLITCPFGRVEERTMLAEVKEAIASGKTTMVQVAPAVRASLGIAFGEGEGSDAEGKMFAAMRKVGFDKVYDTVWSADLTIMEEGYELIGRVMKSLGVEGYEEYESELPQFTSCCPAWVLYQELKHPELCGHLSTAKSPMMMHGAMIKTYGAQKEGIDPADIVSIAVMPCTAKKRECTRPEFIASGYEDVDYVLTTRELAALIKESGIDFESLEAEEPDTILGNGSGAGVIFGVTGGVMEAALRTAYVVLSGTELEDLNIQPVRGMESVRDAEIVIPLKPELQEITGLAELPVRVAIVHGTKNVEQLIPDVKAGTSPYHFIEVMNCPGGCVNGGGQVMNHDIM